VSTNQSEEDRRAELIADIAQRYEKLAAEPLGMSSAWERRASNGKPLLYGGKRGLLAYGTIATWDEFDLIISIVNALPEILPLLKAGPDLVKAAENISEIYEGIYVRISDAEMLLVRSGWEKLDAAIRAAKGVA
jgi:hypothetical protein